MVRSVITLTLNPNLRLIVIVGIVKNPVGGAYAPLAFFAQSQLSIQGDVKYYQSLGASGKIIQRGFCANCGSNVLGIPELAAGLVSIRAGTLDDPEMFQPKFEIFTSQANEWDILNPDIQHFEYGAEKKK